MKGRKSYTYFFDNGETFTVTVGINGVTQEDIDLLIELTGDNKKADIKEDEYIDPKFVDKQKRHPAENLIEQIPEFHHKYTHTLDVAINFFDEEVLPDLTDKELIIYEGLFEYNKKEADIAREHGVTRQAIFNRKEKFIKKMRSKLSRFFE